MKLAKECVFSVNNRLIKQTDICQRGLIFAVFLNIYVPKMEENIVAPMKQHFYKRCVDDIHMKKENEPDRLLVKLNSYHPNKKINH